MTEKQQDAIAALNTLQSNFQTVNAVRDGGERVNRLAIPEMVEYVRRIGYEPSDFNRLKPIHIAGTKGKGSTSAFISSILSQYASSTQTPKNIGLYTSPHLRFVRERIRINNIHISEETFTHYFFSTWDRLSSATPSPTSPPNMPPKPFYFRFLTLMALHTYMSEGVDTAIIECGIGGEYDSTNILVQPTVTGITSLGIDHTPILGQTVESIAWHKAGIIKTGAPCFSAPQPDSGLAVLKQRAEEKGTTLTVVEKDDQVKNVQLGLKGDFQHTNAALAVEIATAHLRIVGHDISTTPALPVPFVRGLESVNFPGRCETRADEQANVTWFIDSGHTVDSLSLSAAWFASHLSPSSPTAASTSPSTQTRMSAKAPLILLFNQQTRNLLPILTALYTIITSSHPFTHVVFTSNRTYRDEGFRPDLQSLNNDAGKVETLEMQESMKTIWEELDRARESNGKPEGEREGRGKADVVVRGSIEEAVGYCRDVVKREMGKGEGGAEERAMVLVTGSLHLVGGFLEVLETGH